MSRTSPITRSQARTGGTSRRSVAGGAEVTAAGGRANAWAVAAIVLAVAAILAFLPGGFSRWVLPKETLLLAAAVCASLTSASGRLDRTTWVFAGAALAWLTTTALLGDSPLAQVFGRWPRYEGLVSLPIYIAAVWVGARLFGRHPSARTRLELMTAAIAWGAIVLAIVSALEAVGLRPIPSDLARPGALLGNATDQGVVAAMFAVVCLFGLIASSSDHPSLGRQLLFACGAGAAVVTTALSGSRAALLGLVVALLASCVLLLVRFRPDRDHSARAVRRRAVWTVGAALAALTVVVLAVPSTRERALGTAELASRTVADRFVIWQESLGIVADRPWTGVGPSGFADAAARAHGPEWYATADPGTVLDSPHNGVLQVAVAGGVPLMLLAAAFVVWVAHRAWLAVSAGSSGSSVPADRGALLFRIAAAGALAGVATAWLTHFPTAATAMLAALLLGSLVAILPASDSARQRMIRTVLLGAWAGALSIATAAEYAVMNGLEAESAPASHTSFSVAQVLRPWDSDVASIAAQAMTARADAGQDEAAGLAVEWGRRAIDAAPGNTVARLAMGVALRLDGRLSDSVATLAPLSEGMPLDPAVALQYGISLAAAGEDDRAREELQRAARLDPDNPAIPDLLARLDARG